MSNTLTTYLILFRGINVGGKNIVPMRGLRALLTDLGFRNVRTYIQSGNAILQSELKAETITRRIRAGHLHEAHYLNVGGDGVSGLALSPRPNSPI